MDYSTLLVLLIQAQQKVLAKTYKFEDECSGGKDCVGMEKNNLDGGSCTPCSNCSGDPFFTRSQQTFRETFHSSCGQEVEGLTKKKDCENKKVSINQFKNNILLFESK